MEQFVAMSVAVGAAMRADRLVRRTLAGWCESLGSRLRANQARSAATAHWAVTAPLVALRRWRAHAQVRTCIAGCNCLGLEYHHDGARPVQRPQPRACGDCTCTVVNHGEFESVLGPYTPPKGVVWSFWALTSGVIVRMSAERPQPRACGGRTRTVVNHSELGRRTRPRTPQRGAFGPHRRQKAA